MRRSEWLVIGGLALAVVGYYLTTLGTQSYRWAPDWVWYSVQQRPTLVVIGLITAIAGALLRARSTLR